jgi:hypothetical protein
MLKTAITIMACKVGQNKSFMNRMLQGRLLKQTL